MTTEFQAWLKTHRVPIGFDNTTLDRALGQIISENAWPIPCPSMLRETRNYNWACAVVGLAQRQGALPLGHPWHMRGGACFRSVYTGPPPARNCPVQTKCLPHPYCRLLPTGYRGVSLQSAIGHTLGLTSHLSAWTHGKTLRLLDYTDVAIVQQLLVDTVGDYPVSVVRDGADVVLTWLDPDAPGAPTHDWLTTANWPTTPKT